MSFYPDVNTLLAESTGTVLLGVYRSYRSILSHMFVFVLSILIVVGINLALQTTPVGPYLRWLSIVPVLILLNIFRTYYNDLANFERHKVTQYDGRLSLNYEMPSIKYSDLRAINVEQDILGRIFDYGDLQLGTAAAEGWEMTIHGIRAPRDLAALVNQLRSHSVRQQLDEAKKSGRDPSQITED